tara:strand:- start:552 stop:1514 length:963 start_codon:yes stop_codon:yes gene_type:complete
MTKIDRKFCIAPMMGYTTPHARKLYRLLSKKAFLFTEMIPAKTLIHSNKKNSIIANENQNPIALQVGGSEIGDLIECCKYAKNHSYDEINLNVGCPSKAVQKGAFGACLMKKKHLVSDCLKYMLDNFDKEVSMKCRIGIDNQTSYDFFSEFIHTTTKSGIKIVYVHARNAILSGLSPKNNRNIPPLKYQYVSRIKKDFPNIQFIINGGINNLDMALKLSREYDGVMIGRLIQSNPFCLLKVDHMFFDYKINQKNYKNIVNEYFEYIKKRIEKESIYRLLSPLLYIFFGVQNGKKFKTEIHQKIKKYKIDEIEKMFLQFIN